MLSPNELKKLNLRALNQKEALLPLLEMNNSKIKLLSNVEMILQSVIEAVKKRKREKRSNQT